VAAARVPPAASVDAAPVRAEDIAEAAVSTRQAATGHDGWYVYALAGKTGSSPAVGGRGLDEEPVSGVDVDGVTALVSRVRVGELRSKFANPDLSPEGWLAKAAATHDGVVQDAFRSRPTVPLRLGCVVESLDHLRDLVSSRQESLHAELRRIGDCGEWRLELQRCGEPVPVEAPAPAADTGRSYLATRSAQRSSARREGELLDDRLDAVRRRLSGCCREIRTTGVAGSSAQLEALVPRSTEGQFTASAGGIASELAEAGWRLVVKGPNPPYSFARPELLGAGDV
jgi:hypothetical protein